MTRPSGYLFELLETWVGVARRVDRRAYAATGVGLMALKYVAEAALFWRFTGSFFSPWDFVNPLLSSRETLLQPAPEWLPLVFYLWTLPFLWIAVSMSIRRAADAGFSPWLGFVVLVPLINLAFMLILALLPSAPGDSWSTTRGAADDSNAISRAAVSVGLGVVIGGTMFVASVYLLNSYGGSLFLGTPLMMGAATAYFFNRTSSHGFGLSALLGALSVLFGCVAMLLFAFEGVLCLLMALPMAVPVAALGGLLGKAIADASRRPGRELAAALVALPLWAVGEAWLVRAPERVVLTAVEIDAPPETVWANVITFPDLPAERAWYFRWGIACPERARIVGQRVGAVRYCEFTTGTFVEPITAWDESRRLAFDVADQPPPLFELSPYPDIHPPHLDGFLRSTRGEFRLIACQTSARD
jgi:uncharacterized membrane protein YhaH (DUF805 family)